MKAIIHVLHSRKQFTLSLNILDQVISWKNQGLMENLIISDILENLKGKLTDFAPFAKVQELENITIPNWSATHQKWT